MVVCQFTVRPHTGGVPAPSDYFYDGAIYVLAHDTLDLGQWYADDTPYAERVQLMFRSNPASHPGMLAVSFIPATNR